MTLAARLGRARAPRPIATRRRWRRSYSEKLDACAIPLAVRQLSVHRTFPQAKCWEGCHSSRAHAAMRRREQLIKLPFVLVPPGSCSRDLSGVDAT